MNTRDPSIQSPLAAATLSLIGAIVCVAAFIPPFSEQVLGSVLLIVAAGLGIGVCVLLHLIFVGILAHRLGRSPWTWALLAMVLFPVGSIIGLVLLHWRASETAAAPSS